MSESKPNQFQPGWKPPVQQQAPPGDQRKLDPQPSTEDVPDEKGGWRAYQGSGKLKGKRAIITGGDSGIGRATATLFAMEGADSLITYLPDLEEQDAEDTKKLVEKYGRKCHTLAVNLKDKNNCKKLVDEAIKQMGGIDILFNNHAYQMMVHDIKDLPEEQWVHTFDTNIHPFFYVSKYALAHMERGSTIINDASVNAYVGRPDLLDYTSTKGAIVAFTRGLSNQFVHKGIRVNAIAPGPVWTPLAPATMDEGAIEGFSAPMGRPSQPSEIATCVVFLASTDSSSISGQTIHCNGGVIVNG
ncbi:hypothetical protein LTR78_006421 [Recurvomyces mirabilis]|uniref:NAD(P)-binding protein n=1 Tax=Recurvomyces mirabilis TaxID=574656 RepID=A0AAE1C090_9PEZI|nr:hypothetical protein LTR78_006421 [Recurvomyces mirabilis]KAK5152308.1 hypothetical protein LTS14_008685 [Recurvomyces mirabilis]